MIVGLAPGLRGANRTGRPFTGDYAGDLLYATLLAFGFAAGVYDRRPDDGLTLRDCAIVNAVRCVPPENKPTPAEIAACRPYLASAIARAAAPDGDRRARPDRARQRRQRALELRPSQVPFAHGARHSVARSRLTLFDSYHCSRYNTNTGTLTPEMFRDVFAAAREHLATAPG